MNIVKIGNTVTHWPSIKMVQCTLRSKDNIEYEAELTPAEVELVSYLQDLKSKLTDAEINKLNVLISKFGDERYSEGSNDEALSGMGAEL